VKSHVKGGGQAGQRGGVTGKKRLPAAGQGGGGREVTHQSVVSPRPKRGTMSKKQVWSPTVWSRKWGTSTLGLGSIEKRDENDCWGRTLRGEMGHHQTMSQIRAQDSLMVQQRPYDCRSVGKASLYKKNPGAAKGNKGNRGLDKGLMPGYVCPRKHLGGNNNLLQGGNCGANYRPCGSKIPRPSPTSPVAGPQVKKKKKTKKLLGTDCQVVVKKGEGANRVIHRWGWR